MIIKYFVMEYKNKEFNFETDLISEIPNIDIEEIINNFPINISDTIKQINQTSNENEILTLIKKLTNIEISNLLIVFEYSYSIKGVSLINDFSFDIIKDKFSNEKLDIFLTKLQEFNNIKNYLEPITLPYYMPSLKKYYDINLNILKTISVSQIYKLIIAPKLDGISCLLVIKDGKIDLYTKGNGEKGRCITYLLKYINLKIDHLKKTNIVLRGELIIEKSKADLMPTKKHLRSIVAGLINRDFSKLKEKDYSLYKHIDAVFYYSIIPENITLIEQLKFIKEQNLKYTPLKILNIEKSLNLNRILREIYLKMKEEYKYDIDGIVLSGEKTIMDFTDKKTLDNMMFAYKLNTIFSITKVKDIIWELSKDLRYIPKIILETVILDNREINKVSGNNANFIISNQIGIGSEVQIRISGDVIPIIDSVIKKSDNIPLPDNYSWDKLKTHFISNSDNLDSLSKRIELFYIIFKINDIRTQKIKKVIKFFNEKKIKIQNIFDYIKTLKEWFSKNSREQILGQKYDISLANSIKTFSEKEIEITKILIATNKFKDFNEQRLNQVFSSYPKLYDIIQDRNLYEIITPKILNEIKGISDITSNNFINGLTYFKEEFDNFNNTFKIDYSKKKTSFFCVMFSGIDNAKKNNLIERFGHKFTEATSMTIANLLVVKSKFDKTTKVINAEKKNIPIMDIPEFEKFIANKN